MKRKIRRLQELAIHRRTISEVSLFFSQIMEAIIGFLADPHPRVRYAACNAIGQMATDFAPVFQKKFHEVVVPGLLGLMDDSANPRVQVRARGPARNNRHFGLLVVFQDTWSNCRVV